MASHDVGIGDFVLLDEITVERVVENLKTRCVPSAPSELRSTGRFGTPKLAESQTRFVTGGRRGAPPRARSPLGSPLRPREGVACASAGGRLEIVKGLRSPSCILLTSIHFKFTEWETILENFVEVDVQDLIDFSLSENRSGKLNIY